LVFLVLEETKHEDSILKPSQFFISREMNYETQAHHQTDIFWLSVLLQMIYLLINTTDVLIFVEKYSVDPIFFYSHCMFTVFLIK